MATARRFGEVLWVAAACVASLLSIMFVDRDAATWSHETFHGAAVFVALTHIIDPIVPASALGFVALSVAVWSGWRPGPIGRRLLCACLAVLVAAAIKDQGKYAFGRLWPETWTNNNPSWIANGRYGFMPFHGGAGWSSFPSGHMTVVSSAAAAFWRRQDRWRWLLAIPVAAVAIGLYGADYHFVGDMVAGTLVGVLCARGMVAWIVTHDVPLSECARTG